MACLTKANKAELLLLAEDVGAEVNDSMKRSEIIAILKSMTEFDGDYYKDALEVIRSEINERKEREQLEREREKEREQLEREKEREQLEREKERELLEREDRKEREQREFELQKLRIATENSARESTQQPTENPFRKPITSLYKILPKFNPDETDISIYLSMFERQAKFAEIEESKWAFQIMALLPPDLHQLILRESEENSKNYEYVKKLLLERFKLSPEAFRQKFSQHSRRPNSRWKDFAYDLRTYCEGWLEGLEIRTFEQLKELMITDQLKRRVPGEVREHFLDTWVEINSPIKLAEKMDQYESVRRLVKKSGIHDRKTLEPSKTFESKEQYKKKGDQPLASTGKSRFGNKSEEFERKREIKCYGCGQVGHIRPSCPERKTRGGEKIARISLNEEVEKCMKPYISMACVNGKEIPLLRDTGASIDVVSRDLIAPEDFTGGVVWVKQPLDSHPKCLPVAQVVLECEQGKTITKAAVVSTDLHLREYIMGNRTAHMISEEKGNGDRETQVLNAITRLQAKREKECRDEEIDSEDRKPFIQQDFKEEGSDEVVELAEEPLSEADGLVKCDSIGLKAAQKECPVLVPLWERAKADESKGDEGPYAVENGILIKRQKDHHGEIKRLIVVPKKFREALKRMCHEETSSHVGVTKTKDRLVRHFFWPGCYKEIEEYVRTCDPCQKAGKTGDKKKAPLKLVPIIREIFSKINIDACGPLPTSSKGNRYLITAICMASKYPEAIPVPNITSEVVVDALLQIFSRTGFPREVQCDQGTSFTSELTTEFFDRFGIKITHSSVAHPQSNPVERFHRTLKRLLRVLCLENGLEWERHLSGILLALRTVTHESIGYSPAELVFGKNLRTPEILLYERWTEAAEEESVVTEHVFKLLNRLKRAQELAVEKMSEVQEKRKLWYDRNAIKREFKQGDQVLVLSTCRANKLSVQWNGPGIVEAKISETNYVVKLPGGRDRSAIYHVNMLKPYYKRPELVNLLVEEKEASDMDGDFPCVIRDPTTFDVEEILGESQLGIRLETSQVDRLRALICEYSEVFSNIPGMTDLVTHDIKLISDKPVRVGPYRASRRQNEILKEEIEKMISMHIIEIGESEYASPMILVETAGRDPRPCIDYRRLNAVTQTEYFPLPNIEERVERVAAAKYITVLDMAKGYWQIPLSKQAQRIAAFVTSFGTYRPLRMPFGLKNAPYFFCKLMADVLKGCEEFAVPYLDDIAVYSADWERHLRDLRQVLERLKRAKLTIKPTKCKFAQDHVQYLGHIVGNGIRTPTEVKTKCIQEFPRPVTKTQVRAFLGLSGYYSRYIPNYAKIAAPLTDTLKGNQKKGEIQWTENCEKAFRELQERLTKHPVLYAPDFDKQFIVQCDASEVALGIVLSQKVGEEEHPILYISRKFSEPEKRYSTVEKECAAIIYAVRKLHYYLDGTKFIIQTDHQPLKWLHSNAGSNSRLLRWALILQPYNFEIVHRAGKANQNADTLSRI